MPQLKEEWLGESSFTPEHPLALVVRETDRAVIEQAGFEIVGAKDEREAVRLLERVEPDVIIVSATDPEATESSIAFIETLRDTTRRAGVPVVVLIDGDEAANVERCFRAGASDIWLASAGPVILKQRLSFLLNARRAFDALQRSSQKLERAQRLARFATWDWSLETNVVRWSSELCQLLSSSGPSSVGIDAILEMVHPTERTRIERDLEEAIENRTAFAFDHRVLRRDGSELVLRQEGEIVHDGRGEAIAVDGFAMDVTALKRAEVQIHSLANYDRLTGLPNRLSFEDLVAHVLERIERRPGSAAVALLDIDRFKDINEGLGHDAGDRLLQEIADRLVGCLRKGDFVARETDGLVARRGGDEFLMLLSDVDEAHHVATAARRILDALSRPFHFAGKEVHVTGSVGIAMGDRADQDVPDLLRQAEIAMYSAKKAGRNAFQFFDEPMNRAVLERFDMEARLRRALAQRELFLVYQPLVNARSRAFVGVEALLRWNHPTKGVLAADEFVPLAEETGLIVSIGRWVMRTACQQLHQWREQGYGSMRLSVNLSPRELRATGFVASIAEILEETRVDPTLLELEITERGVMQNDESTLDVLLRLQEMGVRLAVDDFGTGHTTFHYLKNFPLDTLKIDKSFTRGITVDGKDAAITKALLAMAHRLELNVVAEGVENEDQLSFLGENQCDEVQGYLFGKPIPASELAAALRDHAIAV